MEGEAQAHNLAKKKQADGQILKTDIHRLLKLPHQGRAQTPQENHQSNFIDKGQQKQHSGRDCSNTFEKSRHMAAGSCHASCEFTNIYKKQ